MKVEITAPLVGTSYPSCNRNHVTERTTRSDIKRNQQQRWKDKNNRGQTRDDNLVERYHAKLAHDCGHQVRCDDDDNDDDDDSTPNHTITKRHNDRRDDDDNDDDDETITTQTRR